tara:strand:+ start:270 stop:1115 length:846 start_codon:yes stop_codon:yes gene_type:complete
MKSNLLKLSLAATAFAFSISSSNAQTIDGSTAYMGFSQFLVSESGNNNSNLAESTPDRSSEFLSGIAGVGASGNGFGGFGKFANNIAGLNDSNYGSVVGGPDLTGVGGNSAVKFKTADNRYRLDFLIKNDSLTADFILDSIHFDSRVPNATANNQFVIQYLANNGNSNLQNMGTGANVSNLAFLAGTSLTEGVVAAADISEHDVSIAANIAGNQAGVKLAAGDQASFRISWIGSTNANAQTQMDNLAISGVFAAVPEPSSYALLAGLFACTYMMVRRRSVS